MNSDMEKARGIVDARADGLAGLSASGYGGLVTDIASALRTARSGAMEEAVRLRRALRQAYEYAHECGEYEVRSDNKLRDDKGFSPINPARMMHLHGCRVAFNIRDIIGELMDHAALDGTKEINSPGSGR